jgi:hypothetical protein
MSTQWTPTEIITTWTSAIAVASLLNKFALQPYLPKVARLLSAIISIPSGHIANLIEDVETLWNDITNGTGELQVTIKTTPPPAPETKPEEPTK